MACVDLNDIKSDIKKLQICTIDNKTDIADLNGQLVSINSTLETLNTSLVAINTSLNSLDTRITALEDQLPIVITTDSMEEGNCHVNVRVSSGNSPVFEYNEDGNATSIALTGGTGANGNGLIYTLTFPPHPNGADYSQAFAVYDINAQPDSGIFEIISKTDTQLVYQINQGDDGGSEDDNYAYQHEVKIFGQEQTFISNIYVNGTAV
jgi:hypothetical protein